MVELGDDLGHPPTLPTPRAGPTAGAPTALSDDVLSDDAVLVDLVQWDYDTRVSNET
jgi:hypothetical protein